MTMWITVLLVLLLAAVVVIAYFESRLEQQAHARRALVRWEQRRAEQRIQQLTSAAFQQLLDEARGSSERHGP
jgi:cbb3-type cytochrome oxidase subunit 3